MDLKEVLHHARRYSERASRGELKWEPSFVLPNTKPEQDKPLVVRMMDTWLAHSILGGVGGYLTGGVMGLFLSSMGSSYHGAIDANTTETTLKQVLRETRSAMGSYARMFGTFGFVFSGSLFVVESVFAHLLM